MNKIKCLVAIFIVMAINYIGFSNSIYAQGVDNITAVLDKYSRLEFAESVEISGQLLKALSKADNTDKLLSNIDGIRFVSIDKKGDASVNASVNFESSIRKVVDLGYERAIYIKSKGDNVEVYLKGDELLVIIIDERENFSVVFVRGKITKEIINAVAEGEISLN